MKQQEEIIYLIKLLASNDEKTREQSYLQLRQSKNKSVSPLLIKSLNDSDPLIRKFSVDLLAARKEYGAVTCIIEKLKDPDIRVIMSALISLGELGDIKAIDDIAMMLKDDSPFFYFIRLGAIDALAKMGNRKAVKYLIDAIKEDDILLMRSMIEALIQIDPYSAVEPLIEILNDKTSLCRDQAIEFLGLLGDEKATEHLLNILKEEDMELKICAVQALSKTGKEECILPLAELYKEAESELLKKLSHEAIKIILKKQETQVNKLSKGIVDKLISLSKP